MRFQKFLIEGIITQRDLQTLKIYVDKFFKSLGIDVTFTRHFLDQANLDRNKPDITPEELKRLFRELYKQHGKEVKKLPTATQAVVKDMVTDINMPFVFEWDPKNNEFDLVAKTIQRKGNFMTQNKIFKLKAGYLP